MGISIRTNIASLDAQRNLTSATNDVGNSMRKLASGYRITRGADDSAGLAISEKLRSQVTGTNQAIKNSQDGISLLQTAEGGLSEITNIVQRMRELGVQAGNGTLNAKDHIAIAKELTQLKSEVGAIAGRTTFNGHTLINTNDTASPGNKSYITLQVGSNADGSETEPAATDGEGKGYNELVINVKDYSMKSAGGELKALAAAISNYAGVASKYDVSAFTSASYHTAVTSFQDIAANAGGSGALSSLETIVGAADLSLDKLNLERAEIGSKQNRLEHNIVVQQNQSDNLAAAQSRIQDVDVAAESAKMAKSNILQSAAVSILSQANQAPQLAQKLLG